MITIQNYAKVNSLSEAYELNQKRNARVLGGMMWMRLSKGHVHTAIDLAGLGLDRIEENEEYFEIGCMASLRNMEQHQELNGCFQNVFRECMRGIVGVQFRNQATIGGTVFGRFGFSDILTCLLALDTTVVLYRAGEVALDEFLQMERDNDILVSLKIKKDGRRIAYRSERIARTDLPVITSAVAVKEEKVYISVGARPMKATLLVVEKPSCADQAFAMRAAEEIEFGSNMRGSAEYRKHLASVNIRRALEEVLEA